MWSQTRNYNTIWELGEKMTEKRFTTDNGSNEDVCLVDNLTKKEYESNFEDIVDLLNELNDENEELKQTNKRLKNNIDELMSLAYEEDLLKEIKEVHEENENLKNLLRDLGLLRTDEEVRDIRTEIADKLIKPLFKANGFDVDVDCTDGFTIIPKEELKE